MLEVTHLSKAFGETKAVDDISFTIQKGSVLGLLGHNGAGKSTTIKMVLDILKQDSGDILWDGVPMHRAKVKVGYLPEERGLYEKTRVDEQLIYFGKLEGMKKKDIQEKLDYWLERLEIPMYKTKMVSELSKGNRQKIQLIAALLHDPDFVILDEPFSGLDPVNANIFASIIQELMMQKKTIIMSSHRMEQMDTFCEEILILKKGKAILKGNLNVIKAEEGVAYVEVKTDKPSDKWIEEKGFTCEVVNELVRVHINNREEALMIHQELSKAGFNVRHFVMREKTLHEIFVERVSAE